LPETFSGGRRFFEGEQGERILERCTKLKPLSDAKACFYLSYPSASPQLILSKQSYTCYRKLDEYAIAGIHP